MKPLDRQEIADGLFPDRLVESARGVLRKYGYRHLENGETRTDWAEMWEILRGDFGSGSVVPTFETMPDELQSLTIEYMRRRLIADHLLDACQAAHASLYRDGIDDARVEAYSEAREAYEESVEAFGEARERVEARLTD